MADNVVGNPRKVEASPAIVVNEMALKGSVHVDGNNCNEEDNIISNCALYINNIFVGAYSNFTFTQMHLFGLI